MPKYMWLLLTEAAFQPPDEPAFRVVDNEWAQIKDGYSFSAAVAYLALRDNFKLPGTTVRPAPRAPLWRRLASDSLDGAVRLEAADGSALRLTGVAWGYPGEGPRLLAAILVNLGLFDDMSQAFGWARSTDEKNRSWCLNTSGGDD